MVSTIKNSAMGVLISSIAIAGLGLATPVQAATQVDIDIPVSTVIRGDNGTVHELASEPVNPDYAGMVCDVSTQAENQGSVHPGNDLKITSGTSSVVLGNVERAAGVLTAADGKLTLGNSISVKLIMGQDKVFSAGMTVSVTCEDPPKEIEVCRDGQIVPIKETDRRNSDAEVDECDKIKVCRDGEIVVVTKSEKNSTDSDIAECKTTKVCRNGEVVEVKKSEVKDSDKQAADCDEEEAKPVGKTLPNTGPGAALMGIMGISGLGAITRAWIISKKQMATALLK